MRRPSGRDPRRPTCSGTRGAHRARPGAAGRELSVGVVTAIAAQSRGIATFGAWQDMRATRRCGCAETRSPELPNSCSRSSDLPCHDGLTAPLAGSRTTRTRQRDRGTHEGHLRRPHQDGDTRDRARDELESAARKIAGRAASGSSGAGATISRRADVARLRTLLATVCERPLELGSGAATMPSRLTLDFRGSDAVRALQGRDQPPSGRVGA